MNKKEIIRFLRQLIKIRRKLIEKKMSYRSQVDMQQSADFIQIHIDAYEHRYTNRGLASFFIRHQDKIYKLIPGDESKSHDRLMKAYRRYLFLCETELKSEKADKEVS